MPKESTSKRGSPTKKPIKQKKKKPVSRTTVHRYRKKGYDVGPLGDPDYEKVEAAHLIEKTKGKNGIRFTKVGGYWDDRYRQARALAMERQNRVASGALVEVKKVQDNAFTTARIVRDVLLNLPSRVAGEIAGELGLPQGEGQERVFQILNREILQVLEGMTN